MAIKKYCSVENIQTWFPKVTFDGDTKITPDDIERLIKNNSATIDGSLKDEYDTPISGQYSLAQVQKICEYLTIADVNEIVDRGLGDKGENIKPTDYRSLAMDLLKKISEGDIELIDAVKLTSADFSSFNYDNSIESVIKKDKTQW